MKCVKMGWMAILVGPSASGKSSLVHLLALLTGHRLRVMAMNSAMDTTELLGGFEQVRRLIKRKSVVFCIRNAMHSETSVVFFLRWTSFGHGSRSWRAWTTWWPW